MHPSKQIEENKMKNFIYIVLVIVVTTAILAFSCNNAKAVNDAIISNVQVETVK